MAKKTRGKSFFCERTPQFGKRKEGRNKCCVPPPTTRERRTVKIGTKRKEVFSLLSVMQFAPLREKKENASPISVARLTLTFENDFPDIL